jgi:WD40 repeat protein
VAAGGEDGQFRLLRGRDGNPGTVCASAGSPVRGLALSPDETLAAFGTQKGAIRVVRVPSGEVVATLPGHDDSVESAAFSGDGQLLASGCADRTVRLWRRDGDAFHELLTLRFPAAVMEVQFHPDGRRLAVLVRGEHAVRVWHLDRLRERLAAMQLDW